MPVLSGNDIRRLIKRQPPLVEGWLNLDEQVQANGFDLTLRDVSVMQSAGKIMARTASGRSPLLPRWRSMMEAVSTLLPVSI